MRAALALAISSVFALPASAGTVSFNLSMTVSVSCTVNEVKAIRMDRGLVSVDASCNSPSFNLLMGGELGRMPVRSVSVANATTRVQNNRIHVRTEHPGRYVFLLDYGRSLQHVHSAPVHIQTL